MKRRAFKIVSLALMISLIAVQVSIADNGVDGKQLKKSEVVQSENSITVGDYVNSVADVLIESGISVDLREYTGGTDKAKLVGGADGLMAFGIYNNYTPEDKVLRGEAARSVFNILSKLNRLPSIKGYNVYYNDMEDIPIEYHNDIVYSTYLKIWDRDRFIHNKEVTKEELLKITSAIRQCIMSPEVIQPIENKIVEKNKLWTTEGKVEINRSKNTIELGDKAGSVALYKEPKTYNELNYNLSLTNVLELDRADVRLKTVTGKEALVNPEKLEEYYPGTDVVGVTRGETPRSLEVRFEELDSMLWLESEQLVMPFGGGNGGCNGGVVIKDNAIVGEVYVEMLSGLVGIDGSLMNKFDSLGLILSTDNGKDILVILNIKDKIGRVM